MEKHLTERRETYFPAVICAEYDSPIDALLGLHVPQDEAMDLVAAAWAERGMNGPRCVLARIDGGRQVAAILLPNGRWAACKAFVGQACATLREAERRLKKLAKRGQQGTVGTMPADRAIENAGS
jgi:hypothetical protein